MKSISEIAKIVKEEFNNGNDRWGLGYSGLCSVVDVVEFNNYITKGEAKEFFKLINKELRKNTIGYTPNDIEVKVSNHTIGSLYAWKPYVKVHRNKWLKTLIKAQPFVGNLV